MEKEMAKAVDQPAANAAEDKQEVSAAVKDEASDRLLNESKRYKEERNALKKETAELRAKLEAREKAEQEQQGKYKELFEKSEAQRREVIQKTAKVAIKAKISELATKKGCQSVDALLKLGNAELLEFDLDSGDVNGAELFIEDAMKSSPFLFANQKQISVNASTPGGAVAAKKYNKMSEMPKSELDKLWEVALKQKQQ